MNKTNHPSYKVPEKAHLENLYVIERKSTWDISKLLGVSQSQIRRWFKKLNIKSRSLSESERGRPPIGKDNWQWVGDKVSYPALHTWVRRWKGTPHKCEHCGSTDKKKYEWANIDHKYNRNLDDWIRLCTKCHRKYDKEKGI